MPARSRRSPGLRVLGRLALWLGALVLPSAVLAQEPPATVPEPQVAPEAAELVWGNRHIVTFRSALLGDSPADRVRLAELALASALARKADALPARTSAGASVRFELDGVPLFYLVAADLDSPRGESALDGHSVDVLNRLRLAIDEHREANDLGARWRAAGKALAATAVTAFILWLLWRARRLAVVHLWERLKSPASLRGGWLSGYAEAAASVGRLGMTALAWLLSAFAIEAWVSYVLHQFPFTRPWGERSTTWLLGVIEQFALAIAAAVPGLVVAVFIFLLARVAVRANAALLRRVQRGEVQLPWLDADTVVPTRRLTTVAIWLFALAMAYPYLPGAHSEAFKGVTVLAGLMLSLGASSVVGQALSGMSLMYSRSVRVGEYVRVGETEGTVTALGLFTTKIHTGLGEEVSLPNAVMFAQPIRNYSRLVPEGHFVLHTCVTIGYATPWRQVHALLLEAARRTPAVASEPAPYVVQTALSDFYVEYRLCAQSSKESPGRRIEAMNQLHAHVQDVFNENGVQIMSPHYMADPPVAQVVPPGPWSSRGDQPLTPPPSA
ncbi:MAG: mechanosensitive ion channel [Hydrogenophaga sp.]|uniref:mechanosensitive ion channel family protein n=1 Tax=Hydrogenophaga sp. TaxID=1904254 RepID=UPI001E0920A0|nr:mechanosensitive ion channel domain-containing protein [Hydrogenophaga sp.]MBX3610491.1 mechanosensitive ion channel [Hydrogenophaga sp.]